jgi:hypothetical protein
MVMRSNVFAALATFAIVAGMSVAPVSALDLGGTLGGVVGGVTDTVENLTDGLTGGGGGGGGGGTNVGGLLSLNDNDNDALVNLDIGGSNNNLVNAAVGRGNNPLVNANVSTTGLLRSTSVTIDLAGLGLDVTIDLGILDPDNPNNPNGPNGRPVLVGSLGGGATFLVNCTVNNTKQLLQVAAAGKISGAEIKAWMRAANVQVVPIKLCPAAKKQVAALLAKSQKINLLRRAVMSDALITASLGRTSYDANDVVAVQRKGGQLVVYVY